MTTGNTDLHRWVQGAFVISVITQFFALYLPGTHGPTTGLPLDKAAHFWLS